MRSKEIINVQDLAKNVQDLVEMIILVKITRSLVPLPAELLIGW